MEIELQALETATEGLRTEKTIERADEVCIESRACFIAFIDECAWSHRINVVLRDRLLHHLTACHEELVSVLTMTSLNESDRGSLGDYVKAVEDRIDQVSRFTLTDRRGFEPLKKVQHHEETELRQETSDPDKISTLTGSSN